MNSPGKMYGSNSCLNVQDLFVVGNNIFKKPPLLFSGLNATKRTRTGSGESVFPIPTGALLNKNSRVHKTTDYFSYD